MTHADDFGPPPSWAELAKALGVSLLAAVLAFGACWALWACGFGA